METNGVKQYRRRVFYHYLSSGQCHVYGYIYTRRGSDTVRSTVHEYVPRGGDVLAALTRINVQVEEAKAKHTEDKERGHIASIMHELKARTNDIAYQEQVRLRVEKERRDRLTALARKDVEAALRALRVDGTTRAKAYDYENVYGDVATLCFVR